MKSRLRKLTLFAALLIIMIVIGGCSKKDKEASGGDLLDKSAVINEENDSSSEKDQDKDSTEESIDQNNEGTDETEEDNYNEAVDKTNEADNSIAKDDKIQEEVPISEVPLIEGGIKSFYDQHNMLTGTCINGFVINNFSDHIIENYNSITLENDMKPEAILDHEKSIAAGDIVVNYHERTIDQLEWAKNNNMKARGHVLVWYSQTPQWIFHEDFDTKKSLVDRDTMLARMESYIKQNFELLDKLGYIDMFYAYDIVNEAILDDGSLRDCLWKQIIGDDYIWYAFYYADKYAPEHVKLYYNDFNEQFKTNHIIKLAKSLVDEDGRSLIDGIGCQGHLYTKDSIDDYINTLIAFSATGLDVQITEIDVSLGTWTNILQPTEENLKEQGRWYYQLVKRIIENNQAGKSNVSGITFWGISDAASWRRDRSPLLFDLDFKPKYAYFGAIQDYDHAGH